MSVATQIRWVVGGGLLLLSGCGGGDNLTRTFGLARGEPDEFTVTTRAPLSMPPDLTLRPPEPGAPRPQEQSIARSAEATLSPDTVLAPAPSSSTSSSPGQDALLQAAGPPAPAGIRDQVDAEAIHDSDNQYLTDKLLFWKDPPPPGVLVDPQKESDRLKQAAALGTSPDSGETPVIRRKEHSLFDALF